MMGRRAVSLVSDNFPTTAKDFMQRIHWSIAVLLGEPLNLQTGCSAFIGRFPFGGVPQLANWMQRVHWSIAFLLGEPLNLQTGCSAFIGRLLSFWGSPSTCKLDAARSLVDMQRVHWPIAVLLEEPLNLQTGCSAFIGRLLSFWGSPSTCKLDAARSLVAFLLGEPLNLQTGCSAFIGRLLSFWGSPSTCKLDAARSLADCCPFGGAPQLANWMQRVNWSLSFWGSPSTCKLDAARSLVDCFPFGGAPQLANWMQRVHWPIAVLLGEPLNLQTGCSAFIGRLLSFWGSPSTCKLDAARSLVDCFPFGGAPQLANWMQRVHWSIAFFLGEPLNLQTGCIAFIGRLLSFWGSPSTCKLDAARSLVAFLLGESLNLQTGCSAFIGRLLSFWGSPSTCKLDAARSLADCCPFGGAPQLANWMQRVHWSIAFLLGEPLNLQTGCSAFIGRLLSFWGSPSTCKLDAAFVHWSIAFLLGEPLNLQTGCSAFIGRLLSFWGSPSTCKLDAARSLADCCPFGGAPQLANWMQRVHWSIAFLLGEPLNLQTGCSAFIGRLLSFWGSPSTCKLDAARSLVDCFPFGGAPQLANWMQRVPWSIAFLLGEPLNLQTGCSAFIGRLLSFWGSPSTCKLDAARSLVDCFPFGGAPQLANWMQRVHWSIAGLLGEPLNLQTGCSAFIGRLLSFWGSPSTCKLDAARSLVDCFPFGGAPQLANWTDRT